jgi:hypothetical protein
MEERVGERRLLSLDRFTGKMFSYLISEISKLPSPCFSPHSFLARRG